MAYCYFYLPVLLLIIFGPDLSFTRQIQMGGLFDQRDLLHRVMFAFAVERLNNEGNTNQFRPRIESLPNVHSLKAYQKACDLLMTPVVAMFGPQTEPAVSQIQALCDSKEVPHVMIRQRRMIEDLADTHFSVNLFPPQTAIGSALAKLVQHYGWTSMVILYEYNHALVDLQGVLTLSSLTDHPRITIRKMSNQGDYKPLLKDIKNSMRENHIIVHAELESSRRLLEQASALLMTAEYYHYIFTNWDTYTLDLDVHKASGCNITGVRFVDDQSTVTKDLINDFRDFLNKEQSSSVLTLPPVGIQTSVAVLYDSVNIIAEALKQVGNTIVPARLSCSKDETWRNGSTFMNYIKLLGIWNSSYGLNITKPFSKEIEDVKGSLQNRTLRVTVILEAPFVMLKLTEKTLTGNDRYEGFCIDLLQEVSKILKFNYTIHEVSDNSYGSKTTHNQWNGMVGELMQSTADLAVASLTISYSRSEVIDFTVPFMHLGISILFKKPAKQDPSLFTFLSPLSLDVWIYMLAAYICVSLMLWVLARFSPYEWYNPHPCNPDTDTVENQFSLVNSFWFTVGSLMQQGSDLTPRACSTRVVAGIWWLFTLILISSYTANLAAFLTVQRMESPIESADDLSKQTKIKYGSLGRGSTMTFFKESRIQTYERMWSFMESSQPSVFVNNSREGIARVKKGDYAYLMESSMLEYYVERDCELMQIAGLLDSKGYGIGLPKGSPWREPISQAILRLQEKTVLTSLKQRWWKERRGGGQCSSVIGKSGHNELGLRNVGGVFVVLLGGMVIAAFIAVVEFLHKARKNALIDKRSVCTEMWDEMQFALRCHGSKKPVRRKTVSFQDGVEKVPPQLPPGPDTYVPNAYGGYSAVSTKGDHFIYNLNDTLS